MSTTRDDMTVDKPVGRMSFFVREKLGPKQSMTPEGFLLCEEVPVARSGLMIYGPNETPVETGPDGYVKILREDEDIIRPETIASAQGKPFVMDHPDDDVTPANWKELTHGFMLNVRPGKLIGMDDLLIADLMVTTPEAIKAVQSGKKEVSLGYDADYEQTAPGVGRQTNILINHIALVDQGRCGPRCAIGDQATIKQETDDMSKTRDKATAANRGKSKVLDFLKRALGNTRDAEEIGKVVDEAEQILDEEFGEVEEEGGDTHIHIHNDAPGSHEGGMISGDEDPNGAEGRMSFSDDDLQEAFQRNEAEHQEFRQALEELRSKIEAMSGGAGDEGMEEANIADEEMEEAIRDEAPEGLEEQAASAKDSAYLRESFRDTIAMAEILVPGIQFPTFDGAASPAKSVRVICGFRRKALDAAYGTPEGRAILGELLGGKKLDTSRMTCDGVRALFRSAATMRKAANKAPVRDASPARQETKKPVTPADLNAKLRQHYSK